MIKRLFCKHSWIFVSHTMFHKTTYGCTKCGKTKKLYSYDVLTWTFRRLTKGDTFE